ncbi:MAG TPA: DsbA family protein [Candidatus Limnocylindria bacterium]|nr:DsbA family protein [Candidatus Limnocylindria bacterium]
MSEAPTVIPVYFDFASTLCYAAHRVMGRLAAELAAARITLDWRPIDLARITGWKRGLDVVGPRRAHVLRVARELAGPLRMPPRWIDSRPAAAVALALHGTPKEPAWRERVWTALFEEGRDPDEEGELAAWARDIGLDDTVVDVRLASVEAETDRAHGLGIDGVPTFLLGPWPMPGIQDDATMLAMLLRYVERRRRDG